MASWIVCGFYTPDYGAWASKLIASLEAVGAPYDLVLAEKRGGGWEANTMAKAEQVLAAMDRHPDKVIVWLDVDCTVHGDLSPLADLRGDIGLFMPIKRERSRRMMAVRFQPHSGTLVVKPTREARQFIKRWVDLSRGAWRGDVDQTTFALAMNYTCGVTIELLHENWCARPGYDNPAAVIRHDEASRSSRKLNKLQRWLRGPNVSHTTPHTPAKL